MLLEEKLGTSIAILNVGGGGGSVGAALRGTRQVYFGGQWHETQIYARLALPVGAVISGPAILEQPDTTVLIEPELTGTVDQFGNTLIERKTP